MKTGLLDIFLNKQFVIEFTVLFDYQNKTLNLLMKCEIKAARLKRNLPWAASQDS